MSDTTRLVTAVELEKFPKDDYRYELVDGRLIQMSPVGWEHGTLVGRLLLLLGQHAHSRNLGVAVTEVGFQLRSNPDTVRAPDVAFVRQDRVPSERLKGFWTGPPDLAIEVLSPDDSAADIGAKVDEYLRCGVALVVVIDPDDSTVATYRPDAQPVTLRGTDTLDLDDIVPGFRCQVAEIFA